MRKGVCIKYDIEIGCADDVTSLMDETCGGKQSCNYRVVDQNIDNNGLKINCPKELKGYLDVTYQCMKSEINDSVVASLLAINPFTKGRLSGR